jgi:hypothetical protein
MGQVRDGLSGGAAAGGVALAVKALGRPAGEEEIAEYLDPWTDPRVTRSRLALASAADNRYTLAEFFAVEL